MRAVALFFVVLVAGCALTDGPVPIRTRSQPDDVCLQARVGGILFADPTYGLAFENRGAIWPFGFSARRESGVIVLLDQEGRAIAREGDNIEAAGGNGGADASSVYCDIRVVPREAAEWKATRQSLV